MNSTTLRSREHVSGNVFTKEVVRSKHLFRAANAYSVDTAQLEYFAAQGVSEIYFHEQDTGETYTTSTAAFQEHGFEKQYGGYSRQTFLPLRYWKPAGNVTTAASTSTAVTTVTSTTAAAEAGKRYVQERFFSRRQPPHEFVPQNEREQAQLETWQKRRREAHKLAQACKLLVRAWRKNDKKRYARLVDFILAMGEEE